MCGDVNVLFESVNNRGFLSILFFTASLASFGLPNMSWFNLNVNESLNTLKGQISNVSHVVQGVLTEGILEENAESERKGGDVDRGDESILLGLEAANKRIDELSQLCQDKDEEVRITSGSCIAVCDVGNLTRARCSEQDGP